MNQNSSLAPPIAFFQLAREKAGLKMWVNTGIQPSRGGSILKWCKDKYGLKGNKHAVLAQMEKLVEEAMATKGEAT